MFLGFGIWDLGFGIEDLELKIWDLEFGIEDLGIKKDTYLLINDFFLPFI